MKLLVLGDLPTLMGNNDKPSKITWLQRELGSVISGVQIVSLTEDLLSINLLGLSEKLMDLIKKFPKLERVSVAILCWPLLKKKDQQGNVVDVGASTFLENDLFSYALEICQSLQEVYQKTNIGVDISYHPMLTVSRRLIEAGKINPASHQKFLIDWETEKRQRFTELLRLYDINDVGINVENEPMSSDPWGNLIHSGNRLFTEMVNGLTNGWGVTADIQHCAMALACFQDTAYRSVFSIFPEEAAKLSWQEQFRALRQVKGKITFHISQMADRERHITPLLNFEGQEMNWKEIISNIMSLDKERLGDTWCAVEIDGGHIYPQGYEEDLKAIKRFQELLNL